MVNKSLFSIIPQLHMTTKCLMRTITLVKKFARKKKYTTFAISIN